MPQADLGKASAMARRHQRDVGGVTGRTVALRNGGAMRRLLRGTGAVGPDNASCQWCAPLPGQQTRNETNIGAQIFFESDGLVL